MERNHWRAISRPFAVEHDAARQGMGGHMQWTCENAQKFCAGHCTCDQCTTLRASYVPWVKSCVLGELIICSMAIGEELMARGFDVTEFAKAYMTEEQYARYRQDVANVVTGGATVQ